jgi:hypothetical protein
VRHADPCRDCTAGIANATPSQTKGPASYAYRMFKVGGESWRIGIGGDQAVHSLLFIRDVCRLTPSGADVPPPLAGELPEVELDLSAHQRAEMSSAWLDWWRRFVHVEGATERGEFSRGVDPSQGRVQQQAAELEVFDPPEFMTLGDSDPLQEAARRVSTRALRWGSENRPPRSTRRGAPERKASWLAQKAVAESVIEEYQVSPGRVSAGVIVLAVSGRWSNIPEPGVLLCSDEFLEDADLFLPALKRTFETGLRRSPAPHPRSG